MRKGTGRVFCAGVWTYFLASITVISIGPECVAGSRELIVPTGCVIGPSAEPEGYGGSGYADAVVHTKTGIELVFIPGGNFTTVDRNAGSKEITIRPFYMGKYEVTVDQFERIGTLHYCGQGKGNRLPVVCVDFYEASEYCKTAGLALPTEAEWEWACLGGKRAAFCFGDDEALLGKYAWYSKNSSAGPVQVGQKLPNEWGLYDMHGNVWEWCSGTWVWPNGWQDNVLRGGGWASEAKYCRGDRGRGFSGSVRDRYYGFRVCLRLGEAPPCNKTQPCTGPGLPGAPIATHRQELANERVGWAVSVRDLGEEQNDR